MGKCSVWYMWMPYCLGGSEEVVEQVKWGAAVTVLSASTRGVCRKNVRGNTTAGKVATMNACANSRHLQNSWKSCLWALFCHLGGGCQSQTGFEQQNIHQVNFWYWGISKFLNLNVLTAILGPPKNWRLIWKLWNLRSSTLGSKIWRSGIRGTDPDPAIHPSFLKDKLGQKCGKYVKTPKWDKMPLVFLDVAPELKWFKLLSIRKILFSWCHIVSKYEL